MSLFLLFFFQAEDGIRDDLVTGVQTCALPISCCASGKDAGRTITRNAAIGRRAVACTNFLKWWTTVEAKFKPKHEPYDEIGRASCRERGEIGGVREARERSKSELLSSGGA